jgi:Argininosuccinate synthase
MKKCVLAYSGGLDTSVILGWLIEQGYEVVAVYVDLGQPCEDREATLQKARDCGAVKALLVDAREELCRDFAFPTLQWQARYEGTYLLGTSIARPLISRVCVDICHAEGATVFAHGATGKGNDQCRFQLAAEAIDPTIELLAPWRIAAFRERFPGRKELIEFCAARSIPVKASKEKPYSSDENCLHTSYEAGLLEELDTDGYALVDFGMSVSPQEAPDEPETVRIEFAAGLPVRLNGSAQA